MTSPEAVKQHYSGRGLAERIFTTLAAEGHDTGNLTPGILAPYDEFHVGGLAATERFSGRLSRTRHCVFSMSAAVPVVRPAPLPPARAAP